MTGKRVLITGGAGFIGSALSRELLTHGYRVRVLDNLSPQVHEDNEPEIARCDDVELIRGDVRDPDTVARALQGVDAVYHFAAMVGVGQSMYLVTDYVAVNDLGTAVLLQALISHPVERLVVASSMSIYGEGLRVTANGAPVHPEERPLDQLRRREWEIAGEDGMPLEPIPTPEWKRPALTSVYALGKFVQERMCLLIGRAYGIDTVALRFFNVYGPGQALSNPYTGVLAIFAARLLNEKAPLVFEDGRQRRDFVNVRDVARCCRLALEAKGVRDAAFNVGSGRNYTIVEVAEALAGVMGLSQLRPNVTGQYRAGDIRHCFADIGAARRDLGYEPQVDLTSGLEELVGWLGGRTAVDRIETAAAELSRRGLLS